MTDELAVVHAYAPTRSGPLPRCWQEHYTRHLEWPPEVDDATTVALTTKPGAVTCPECKPPEVHAIDPTSGDEPRIVCVVAGDRTEAEINGGATDNRAAVTCPDCLEWLHA